MFLWRGWWRWGLWGRFRDGFFFSFLFFLPSLWRGDGEMGICDDDLYDVEH